MESFPCPWRGLKPDRPARSQVNVLNELPRLTCFLSQGPHITIPLTRNCTMFLTLLYDLVSVA